MLKFILSFLVVAIHFDPFGIESLRQPLLMLPVPLFFIISGFLFFRSPFLDGNRLYRFVLRNLKLYAAYLVLFLPYYARIWWNDWFSKGILYGMKKLFLKFLFGSTFRSSWFIIALVIGVIIVYYLSKIRIKHLPLVVGGVFYFACMLQICYGNLFSGDSLLNRLVDFYPGTIYQGFPIAVFWVAVGKLIADYEQYFLGFRTKKKILLTVISCVLLVGEYVLVTLLGFNYTSGYCIMQIPVCIMIFILTLGLDLEVKNARFFEGNQYCYVLCAYNVRGNIDCYF